MTALKYKTFQATITYRVEMTDDFVPKLKEEKTNWKEICQRDTEILKPKVVVKEIA
jgi:hypothetical protein